MEPLQPDDPQRIAGYRLVARLGQGGMGRVYLARSPGGRPVALKVIRSELAADPEFRARFVREVDAARAVSGVFTAPVLDADPRGDPAWLATGYVAGISLQEAVDRFGPLPPPAVATLAAGLAEALIAVHSAGLIHRDLKPANVMLSADGPRLIDFGIARAVAAATTMHTQVGTVIGSPGFMSPEQASGVAVGPAADMFSLASVLVFALTTHRTFTGDSAVSVLYNVVNSEPDLAGVPAEFVPFLSSWLAKDPAARPTPHQAVQALAQLRAGDGEDDGWDLPEQLTQVIMERSAVLIRPAAQTGAGQPTGSGRTTAVPSGPIPATTGPTGGEPFTAWLRGDQAGAAGPAQRDPGPAGDYGLGIDLGTTQTAAAIWRNGRAEAVPLGGRGHSVPSVVFLREDGVVLIGEAAARRGIMETERVAREFKRRFGDAVPLVLGGQEVTAEELTAQLLRWVLDTVTEREGAPPAYVTLTHPAAWRAHRLQLLGAAAKRAGLSQVGLLAEPVAAAAYYASTERLPTDALLAVYDLGGGTFDATVVRKTPTGFAIQGQPTGDDNLGGVDFDQAVLDYVATTLGPAWRTFDLNDPAVRAGLEQVRAHATEVKEALSTDVEATMPVILPGVSTHVRITRAELEVAIRKPILHTIDLLTRAITSANAKPGDVHAALLIGGSSRIPLVSELIAGELGIPVAVDAHPKYAVCLGAAIATGVRLGPSANGTGSQPSAAAAERTGSRRLEVSGVGGPDAPASVAVNLAATGIHERVDVTAPTGSAATNPPQPTPSRRVEPLPVKPPPVEVLSVEKPASRLPPRRILFAAGGTVAALGVVAALLLWPQSNPAGNATPMGSTSSASNPVVIVVPGPTRVISPGPGAADPGAGSGAGPGPGAGSGVPPRGQPTTTQAPATPPVVTTTTAPTSTSSSPPVSPTPTSAPPTTTSQAPPPPPSVTTSPTSAAPPASG